MDTQKWIEHLQKKLLRRVNFEINYNRNGLDNFFRSQHVYEMQRIPMHPKFKKFYYDKGFSTYRFESFFEYYFQPFCQSYNLKIRVLCSSDPTIFEIRIFEEKPTWPINSIGKTGAGSSAAYLEIIKSDKQQDEFMKEIMDVPKPSFQGVIIDLKRYLLQFFDNYEIRNKRMGEIEVSVKKASKNGTLTINLHELEKDISMYATDTVLSLIESKFTYLFEKMDIEINRTITLGKYSRLDFKKQER